MKKKRKPKYAAPRYTAHGLQVDMEYVLASLLQKLSNDRLDAEDNDKGPLQPGAYFAHFRVVEGSIKKGAPHPVLLYHYHRGRKDLAQLSPGSRGGATLCQLIEDDGSIYYGLALCSMSDAFNYTLGRKISLGRAKASAGL